MNCPHKSTNETASIIEGICPRCGEMLEREAECGRCSCCGMGWSITPDEVTMHFDVLSLDLTTDSGRIVSGPAKAYIIKSTPNGPPLTPSPVPHK